MGGEAQCREEVYQPVNMEVVEKPLDVKQDQGPDVVCLHAGLDGMGKTHGRVNHQMVVPRPKLGWWEEVELVGIQEDALCNDLLQELAAAL